MARSSSRHQLAPHPRSMADVVGVVYPDWDMHADFVILDLEKDIERGMYLTLELAKNHHDSHVRAMYRAAVHFSRDLFRLMEDARGGNAVAAVRAKRMLTFPEARELRMGYACNGSNGSGVGAGHLREHLFDVLMANPEAGAAMCSHPDTLGLLPGIGLDRESDIVATIAKEQIIAYTQDQADFWHFSPACRKVMPISNCWSHNEGRLVTRYAEVPVDDLGRPFLLVPKEICRSSPPMRPDQYARDFDLDWDEGDGDEATTGDSWKWRLLADATANPGRIKTFVEARMKDESQFQPRREYRRDL